MHQQSAAICAAHRPGFHHTRSVCRTVCACIILVFGALGMHVPGAYAQRDTPATLVAQEAALGGDLRVSAYGFPPQSSFELQLRRAGAVIPLEGATLHSDASGVIAPVTFPLPQDVTPGNDYSLEAIGLRGALIAAARLELHPAPVVTLAPSNGPPGSTVQVTVENLFPGSLQVNFGQLAVIGPLPVSGSTYTGVFIVPDAPPGTAVPVTAFNRVGDRLVGRGQASFRPEAPFPWEDMEIRSLTIPDGVMLEPGKTFVLRGQLDPPPPDPTQVRISPFWQSRPEDTRGFQAPIGIGPAQIEPDGAFEVSARVPSLLRGAPFPVRDNDQVGVSLVAADSVAVQSTLSVQNLLVQTQSFMVQPVKDMPNTPQDGQPIPNLPAPGPDDPHPLQVQIEPLGAFSTTMTQTVDINGIVPVLDIESAMSDLQIQQKLDVGLGWFDPTCIVAYDPADEFEPWKWVMRPDETAILAQFHHAMNPFTELAQVNSIAQFNALQRMRIFRADAPESADTSGPTSGHDDPDQAEEVLVLLYRAIVDASSVIDGDQHGYGFVDDEGFAQPFIGYFAFVPSYHLAFEIEMDQPFSIYAQNINFTAIPTANPAPIRLPPLPPGWQSSFKVYSVTLPGQERIVGEASNLDFGPYRSLVKPGGANIQVLSTSAIDIEVRLWRYGDSLGVPDVTMTYRGSPLNVERVGVPVQDTKNKCAPDKIHPHSHNTLGVYAWRASIPAGHTQPVGAHDLVISATEGSTTVMETAVLNFTKYPDWFDNNPLSGRTADWSPIAVTLKAVPQPPSTDVSGDMPEAGHQENQLGMGQQAIECRLNLGNSSHFKQTGSMTSAALNNDAKPLGYSGTDSCSGDTLPGTASVAWLVEGTLPSGATQVELPDPGVGVTAEVLTESGIVTIAAVETFTILDTGYIRIFSYGFGIPEVAWVGISVDFRVRATAGINATVPSEIQTIFAAGVEVAGIISIDVLFGLASGSGAFLTDIGVQLPVTFKLDGGKIDVDKCFFFRMRVRVTIKAFWQTVYSNIWPIFQGMSPSNCFQAWAAALAMAQDDFDAPEVPNAGPALATDGFGRTLALWSTEGNEVVYSRLENNGWSAPQPIAADALGMDPAIAFYAPDQAVAVWTRSSLTQAPDPETPLAEILSYQHLVYATWDGNAWSTPQMLTLPTTGDGMAALAGCMSTDPACPAGGEVIAAWVHDPAGDFTQRRFNVNYATFANSTWSAIQSVEANDNLSDTEPDVAYRDGVPVIIWVRDPDRDFETFDDRQLAVRELDGASQVQVLSNLPGGVMNPSLAADADGNLQVGFNVVAADDLPLGNRRMLYRAHGACNGGPACNWSAAQVVDELGRTIFAESPIVTIAPKNGGGEEVVLTYRAMGLEPATVPAAPLFTEPEPPGVADRTGELAQLNLPLTLASVKASPGYLTQDGAVNWQPTAIYDPMLNSVLALAVQEPSLAVAQSGMVAQNTAHPLNPGAPLVVASVPQLPNFVLKHAVFAPHDGAENQPLDVQVTVQNSSTGWSPIPGEDGLIVEARWGSPANPVVGQAEIGALGAGETTRLNMQVAVPALPNQAQSLYVTVNPGQTIAEQTATDNTFVLAYAALPAPVNIHGSAVPGHPSIWLIWDASTDPRVTGYRIYRLGPGNQHTPVGSTFVEEWVDTNAKWNESVVYGVTTFGADLTESELAIVGVTASEPPELSPPIQPDPEPDSPIRLYVPTISR